MRAAYKLLSHREHRRCCASNGGSGNVRQAARDGRLPCAHGPSRTASSMLPLSDVARPSAFEANRFKIDLKSWEGARGVQMLPMLCERSERADNKLDNAKSGISATTGYGSDTTAITLSARVSCSSNLLSASARSLLSHSIREHRRCCARRAMRAW